MKKKFFWIMCIVIVIVLCLLFIRRYQMSTTITKLYYQIYESDEKIVDVCRMAHSKGVGAKYDLSEIIAMEYTCKCVVEENKEIFANAFKSLSKEQQKNFKDKISDLRDIMADYITPSIIVCSSELEDKGFRYFEHKYGKIMGKAVVH